MWNTNSYQPMLSSSPTEAHLSHSLDNRRSISAFVREQKWWKKFPFRGPRDSVRKDISPSDKIPVGPLRTSLYLFCFFPPTVVDLLNLPGCSKCGSQTSITWKRASNAESRPSVSQPAFLSCPRWVLYIRMFQKHSLRGPQTKTICLACCSSPNPSHQWESSKPTLVQYRSHQPLVAMKHLKCAVSIKYAVDFKDLIHKNNCKILYLSY